MLEETTTKNATHPEDFEDTRHHPGGQVLAHLQPAIRGGERRGAPGDARAHHEHLIAGGDAGCEGSAASEQGRKAKQSHQVSDALVYAV